MNCRPWHWEGKIIARTTRRTNDATSVDTDGEVMDYHMVTVEDETSLVVYLSMAEGWNTTFSVVTHLGDVESAATEPRRLFPESAQPGPPQQVATHLYLEFTLQSS